MKAVVFDGQRVRLDGDYPLPLPQEGEVRIRTRLAGICNTDLEVVRGYAHFTGVLGHEFVGVVDQAAGPDLIGRRVVGEINITCGTCESCRAGLPTHCLRRKALGIHEQDGVLAEFFCLPAANLHPVPDELPDRLAVFAEPLAAACEVLDQVHVRPGDRVVVLGDGKLGLLVAQVLALTGCDLIVVGRHEAKLAILAARGITTSLADRKLPGEAEPLLPHSGRTEPVLVHQGRADLVVECTGRAAGFAAARQLVRPRGTLVLKTTYHGLVEVDLTGLAVDEIHVVGSRCGPFPAALRLLERGLVDVAPLIAAEYPLDQALAALEHAGQPGSLKVLVRATGTS